MNTKLFSALLILSCTMVTTAASNKPAEKTYKVKTAREFIDAVGPNRTIVITTEKPLNLTEAINDMIDENKIREASTFANYDEQRPGDNDNVAYCSETDGNGLVVRNCPGLKIRAGKKNATLLATPRYVNVMEFRNCDSLSIDHIVMGHTDDGYCDKGVIEFDNCISVNINDCDFYGCGTEGFIITNCNNVVVNRSAVHHCTYHIMHVGNSHQIRFNDCTFHHNREYEQLVVYASHDVDFTGCYFDSNVGPMFQFDDYVNFYSCTFRNCRMESIDSRFAPQGFAVLAYCTTIFGEVDMKAPTVTKPNIREGRYSDGITTYIVRRSDPYRYVFTPQTDPDKNETFAVQCISAADQEYIVAPEYPDLSTARYGVTVGQDSGMDFVRLVDDGGELIKSFVFISKP